MPPNFEALLNLEAADKADRGTATTPTGNFEEGFAMGEKRRQISRRQDCSRATRGRFSRKMKSSPKKITIALTEDEPTLR